MSKLITLPELARYIAELTHCTIEDAENFLRETFRLATDKLESDHRSEIPGTGTFIISDNAISFAPEGELAEELNAPFAAFEAIELPDDFEQFEGSGASVEASDVSVELREPEESVAAENASDESPAEDGEEIAKSADFEEMEESVPLQPVSGVPEPRHHAWVHWIWAAACLFCFALGWFAASYRPEYAKEPEPLYVQDMVEEMDSVVEPAADTVKTLVPPPVVTDTISSTRYLTTMARRHYGRMEYWVYIYEANADKLGHPDRLDAGTVVTIPVLDFGADDEVKIGEAESMAREIYERFN